jgi:hypothetical protein
VAKRFKMNLTTADLSALGGTDSQPHPANYPLGSVESRAAARAMIQPDRMRAGDLGTEADGSWWSVVNNEETGGVTQIVFPCCFGGWSIDGKGHSDNCKATSIQRSVRADVIAGERAEAIMSTPRQR